MSHPSVDAPAPARAPALHERRGLILVGFGDTGGNILQRVGRVLAATVVDLQPERPAGVPAAARYVAGDGTSRLVLQQAGLDEALALVAATSDDAVNIEAARIAVEAGVPEVVCRVKDPSLADDARAVGAVAVTEALAMAGALTAQLPGVLATTADVGLGEGDILQVRVMPGSPVVDHTVRQVATREYLVAAIYRGGRLVIPHGDTRIAAGDQVLLVGRPDTLRAVAEYFRLGGAQFPHQYGHTVVAWADEGDDRVLPEARWLREATGTRGFAQVVEAAGAEGEDPRPIPLAAPRRRDGSVPSAALDPIFAAKPGVFVVSEARQRLFGERGMGRLRSLLAEADCPVLLARGRFPYRRVLAPVAGTPSGYEGIELAVDVARSFGASLTAVHVAPPRFIGGLQSRVHAAEVASRVESLGRLYSLPVRFEHAEGNPIREVAARSADADLVVVSRTKGQGDSYLDPDVALRIALSARCSALILTRA